MSKYRRDCFETHIKYDETGPFLVCHLCGGRIDPAREPWEAEHSLRRTLGGSDAPANVLPAHKTCHRDKTNVDISSNAKGKRVRDKHFGIVTKKKWWKPDGYKHRWGRR